MMKLGIGSYTLTWAVGVPGYDAPQAPVTAIDLINLAAAHGAEVVQLADNLPPHKMSGAELAAVKSAADAAGIELEIGTRGTEPAHLLAYLDIAGKLGARLVRTIITEPDLPQPLAQLREALPSFEAAGVTLALENHGLHTTKQLASLLDALDSPLAGCCLDTINSFGALDSPAEVIRDLSPYVVNLHIKDFTIARIDHQMGFVVTGTPAGAGKLDIPALIAHIRSLGRSPNAILELWTPYAGTVEATIAEENRWFRQSMEYLRSLRL